MSESVARQALVDGSTARPAPFRGVGSELVRWAGAAYLKLGGWKIHGDWPPLEKAVLVAAPHTSTWDGLNMLAAAGYYRVKLRWMGKASLFRGPFGPFMRALGGIAIQRDTRSGIVGATVAAFAHQQDLVVTIPAEGTRSAVREWKSGFYHIAIAARVPILLTVLDYGRKHIRLAAVVYPGGDYEADIAIIRAHYADAVGKHAGKFSA